MIKKTAILFFLGSLFLFAPSHAIQEEEISLLKGASITRRFERSSIPLAYRSAPFFLRRNDSESSKNHGLIHCNIINKGTSDLIITFVAPNNITGGGTVCYSGEFQVSSTVYEVVRKFKISIINATVPEVAEKLSKMQF